MRIPRSITIALIAATTVCIAGHPKMDRFPENTGADSIKVWAFFADKDTGGKSIRARAVSYLSERAVRRRARDGIAPDIADIPVDEAYLTEIEALGARLLRKSRWLNGASFMAPTAVLDEIAELDFVEEIRPVGRFRRPLEPIVLPRPVESLPEDPYGYSRDQLEMLGAIDLHDAGYAGEGVLVGFLDSGFRLTHRAFDSLIVIAKYDFVHDDTTVDYDSVAGDRDTGGFRHGTQTLSCVAAFFPGKLIGTAYKAEVALAKTEEVDTEYIAEEDNWVAGIEWLDSVGAEIVTSSLGYIDFEGGYSYEFSDLDGNTAVTTIAADCAARLGICVVNSAGNEGEPDNPWGHLVTPADGDSVLAVAAVGNDHIIAPFSSPGPTFDGRIKPDCAAVGYGAAIVDPSDSIAVNPHGFGTSFSCPLIAGLCAAVKSASPGLSGYNLALAVRNSGDRRRAFDPAYPADSADNRYGWGIPKGLVAAGLTMGLYGRIIDAQTNAPVTGKSVVLDYGDTIRTVLSDPFGVFVDQNAQIGDLLSLSVDGYAGVSGIVVDNDGRAIFLERIEPLYPNPAGEYLYAAAHNSTKARLSVYSSDGVLVFDRFWEPGSESSNVFRWDLENSAGRAVANGVYIVRLATDGEAVIRKIAVIR